ncbi:MAG: type IV pilus biogenesis/stability protein PilW [Gammaproteobacteria bacterium]|nr:type IV pilus biogenesis/stability protein PilW [Gammaproteobacteria bacterium]
MKGILSLLLSFLILSACTSQGLQKKSSASKAAKINVQMGITYMGNHYYDLALEKLKRALDQDSQLPSAHNAIAVLYGVLKDTKKADYHFRQALQLQPEYPEAHNNYGQYLCRQGAFDQAEKQFQQAATSPLYRSAHNAYLNAGLCLLRVPDYTRAGQYFRKALKIYPEWDRALMEMALLQYSAANYLNARAWLQRYAVVSRARPDALWLGVLIERKLGDVQAMKSYQDQLQRLFPTSIQAQKSRRGMFE